MTSQDKIFSHLFGWPLLHLRLEIVNFICHQYDLAACFGAGMTSASLAGDRWKVGKPAFEKPMCKFSNSYLARNLQNQGIDGDLYLDLNH